MPDLERGSRSTAIRRNKRRTAVHACHAAHRKRRSVTGGWRYCAAPVGGGPEPDPGYCPPAGLAARLAFRTHLTQPQLSRHLVNLPVELTRQAGALVLVPHCSTSISDRTPSVGSRAGDPDLRAVRVTSSRSGRRAERQLPRAPAPVTTPECTVRRNPGVHDADRDGPRPRRRPRPPGAG